MSCRKRLRNLLLSQELVRITTHTELALHYVRMESFHQDLSISTISIDEVIRPLLKKYATFFISKKLHLDYVPTREKGRHGFEVVRRYRRASVIECGEIYA